MDEKREGCLSLIVWYSIVFLYQVVAPCIAVGVALFVIFAVVYWLWKLMTWILF